MVIKKPYAFLIKNFRVIHGLLFILLLFISIKTLNIYTFFLNYTNEHMYLSQINLASKYISFFLYIACLLAVLISFIIYYLLAVKNKSNKLYIFTLLYYILLIVFLIYYRSIFVNLQTKVLDTESVRALRDICILTILPQIAFIFIILGRTLGFNLKQFDFRKDLEELEIVASDNEEVEVTLGNDTYKFARFFRKTIRLTKYYILENKILVIGVCSIIIVSTVLFLYSKVNIYAESYNETDDIQASSLWFKANESFITSADSNNVVISNGKHYILVNVKVSNKLQQTNTLTRETFRLNVKDEMLIPTFSHSDKFSDIGVVFSPYEMKPGEDKDYIVVFEIKSADIEKEYIFRIKDGKDYKDIIIKPSYLNKDNDQGNYVIPNQIKFDKSLLKKSSLIISSCEIKERFKEKYSFTIDGIQQNATYSILPSSTNKEELTILKIKGSFNIDESIFMKKYLKYPADLFEKYGVLRYRYQGNYKNLKLNKIKVDFDPNNYSYLEIPKEVENANKIELIIAIRGVKYTINLNSCI